MLWHREMHSTNKTKDKLPWTIQGLNSWRSDSGNIASCQLSSTFVPCRRYLPKNTVPMMGLRQHRTTDNPSEMNRCWLQSMSVLIFNCTLALVIYHIVVLIFDVLVQWNTYNPQRKWKIVMDHVGIVLMTQTEASLPAASCPPRWFPATRTTLSHLPLDKMAVISQIVYFQLHFREWKVWYFD